MVLAHNLFRFPGVLGWILISFLMNGCLGNSAKTSFYVLNPVSSPSASIRLPENTGVIGLGPVRIPKYLDRPQIVTRTDRNRIRINDSHQWAGPLKEDVLRVIRENLSLLLDGHHTIPFPWKNTEGVVYQIKITVQRLDVEKKLAVLTADWSIADIGSPASSMIYRSNIETPVSGNSYADKVSGINDSLNQFSLEVATGFADYIAGHQAAKNQAPSRPSD